MRACAAERFNLCHVQLADIAEPERSDVQDRIGRRQLQFALAFSAATDCAASASSLP
jgi:hypothetical protein